jgi:molybdopterin/thiamine biosynthesis adenylyltransferase
MAWFRRREGPAGGGVERHSPEPGGDLYSRNWAFIAQETQTRLAQTTLFTAGTGLGSVIAVLAARTGFQRFILADGDRVALSNLNRQAFTRADLGRNKAKATARMIHAIAPNAQVKIVPRYLDSVRAAKQIARADLLINTIDLTSSAFLGVNRVARAQGRPVIFPMNLGWGGVALVFTPESMSLDEFVAGDPQARSAAGAEHEESDAQLATRLITRTLQSLPGGVPPYLQQVLRQYVARTDATWPYDPQLGAAAHITAALSVRAATALACGEPLRVAPDVIWADAYASAQPAPTVASKIASTTVVSLAGDDDTSPVESETEESMSQDAPQDDASLDGLNDNELDEDASESGATAGSSSPPLASARLFRAFENTDRADRQRWERSGSGLVVIVARHDTLEPDEAYALGAYRLEQYTSAGLYEKAIVEQLGLTGDPAMDNLAPQDVHIAVGDSNGRILCYLCMQSTLPEDVAPGQNGKSASDSPLISSPQRPLFPCETEYGSAIYARHPAIGPLPVTRVREVARLVRNQTMTSPWDGVAVHEAILAIFRVLCDPVRDLAAAIGANGPEVRRLLKRLHVPVAYASNAAIVGDNLNGGKSGETLLWSEQSHAEGRFRPMAISITDLLDAKPFFDELERALSAPATEIQPSLAALSRVSNDGALTSRFATASADPSEGGVVWTADVG